MASSTDSSTKPLLEHLEDLRWTLIKCLLAVAVGMVVCFVARKEILDLLTAPLFLHVKRDAGFLNAFGVADSLMVSFKVAAFAGLLLSMPVLLYFVGQFLLPALTPSEKKMLLPVFACGLALFITGVLACYTLLLPVTLRFFIQDSAYMGIQPRWTIQNYISFVTQFCAGTGFSFEMPVVIVVLAKLNVISSDFMRQKRRYAIAGIFILAACITPTSDCFTMTMVAAPLLILYEICVVIVCMIEKNREKNFKIIQNETA